MKKLRDSVSLLFVSVLHIAHQLAILTEPSLYTTEQAELDKPTSDRPGTMMGAQPSPEFNKIKSRFKSLHYKAVFIRVWPIPIN